MPVTEQNDTVTYLEIIKSLNAILTTIRVGQGPLDVVESVKKQLLIIEKLPRLGYEQGKAFAEIRQRLFEFLATATSSTDNRTVLIAYIRTLGVINSNLTKVITNPLVLGKMRGILTSAMSALESMTPIGSKS